MTALLSYTNTTFCSSACISSLSNVPSSCTSLSNWTATPMQYNVAAGTCSMTQACSNALISQAMSNGVSYDACNLCNAAWITATTTPGVWTWNCTGTTTAPGSGSSSIPAGSNATTAAPPTPAQTPASTPAPSGQCTAWYASAAAACSGPMNGVASQVSSLATQLNTLGTAAPLTVMGPFLTYMKNTFCTSTCPGNLSTASTGCTSLSNWTANGYNVASGLCVDGALNIKDACKTPLQALTSTNAVPDVCGNCTAAWIGLVGLGCPTAQLISSSITLQGANVSAILSNLTASTALFTTAIATSLGVSQSWLSVSIVAGRRLESVRRLQTRVIINYNVTIPAANVAVFLTQVTNNVAAAVNSPTSGTFYSQIQSACAQVGAGAPTSTFTPAVNLSPTTTTPAPTPAPALPRTSSGTPAIAMKCAAVLAVVATMIGL